MTEEFENTTKPSRWRRVLFWLSAPLVLICVLLVVLYVTLPGRVFAAPEWLRDKVNARIAEVSGPYTFGFRDLSLQIQDGWMPTVMMNEITVAQGDGTPLLRLNDASTELSLPALLNAELKPSNLRLSGAQVQLRRESDGTIGFAIGDNNATIEQAQGFGGLAEELKAVFETSELSGLKRIEAHNLTVQYQDARTGQFWRVDGGRIELTRDGEDIDLRGDFALLGTRDYATTLELNYSGSMDSKQAEYGMSFEDMPTQDLAGQSPALSWLVALDAPISGALRARVGEEGALGPLNATLQIGAGVFQPADNLDPIEFEAARSYFTYDPGEQSLVFDELSLDSSWVKATATGTAYLEGMETGTPSDLLAQMVVSNLIVHPPEFYEKPIELEQINLDARITLDPFQVSVGQVNLRDQDQNLNMHADVQALEDGWGLAVEGHMDGLAPERLMELWPVALEPKTREWVQENVTKATLSNLQFAVRLEPEAPDDVYLGFDFSDLTVRYIKTLPPVTNAKGRGELLGNRFAVVADRGIVTPAEGGVIDVTGTSFVVPDVAIKDSPAQARLKTSSSITSVLSLLDEPPFEFLKDAGQSVDMADGRARLNGVIDLRLKKNLLIKDVDFDVSGELSDVRSTSLVEGRVLNAPRIAVKAKADELALAGSGRIGQVPVTGNWVMPLGKNQGRSQLNGEIELSETFAKEFGVGLPPGSVTGKGPAQMQVNLLDGQPGSFTLRSDLRGVGLRLDELEWNFGRNSRGSLEVAGSLGSPPVIENIKLDAGGLKADGRVTLRPTGDLDRATFRSVMSGTWLRAPVQLVGRGAGVPPEIVVDGGFVDLSQTSLGGDRSASAKRNGGPVKMRLDRLLISEGITLTDFRADLDMSKGTVGTFSGRVNGGAPIQGQVVPQNGRSAFKITSNDAGGVLQASKLLKQARNGELELILTPASGKGTYNGRLTTTKIRVKDAPAMAALLNGLSVIGLLEQLGGEGIHFHSVEADFQLSPDRVTLLSGNAVGPSMGISMEGYYFLDSGNMDMQGVVSPVYLVNAIGGFFSSRRGEGLFGFNYNLKGPASNPKVGVNPLSLFTPGMFRDLFRSPPPKVQR